MGCQTLSRPLSATKLSETQPCKASALLPPAVSATEVPVTALVCREQLNVRPSPRLTSRDTASLTQPAETSLLQHKDIMEPLPGTTLSRATSAVWWIFSGKWTVTKAGAQLIVLHKVCLGQAPPGSWHFVPL